MTTRRCFAALMLGLTASSFSLGAPPAIEETITGFTDRYCSSCHNDVDREGGLDLTSLKFSPADPDNFQLWVKMHDRVAAGEMPPKEKKRPAAADLAAFVGALDSSLTAADRAMVARDGRA